MTRRRNKRRLRMNALPEVHMLKYERDLSDSSAEDYEREVDASRWRLIHEHFIARKWGERFEGLFLDIGCGTGVVASNLISAGREVVATDISRNMCKITKRNCKTDVVIANGLSLPFKDNAFSVTCIAGVLHHLPHLLKQALAEIGRCSSKAICLVEPSTTSPPIPLRFVLFARKIYDKLLFKLVESTKITKYTFSIYEKPLDPTVLTELLKEYGFEVLEVKFYNNIPKLYALLSKGLTLHLIHSLISVSRGTHVAIIAEQR